MRKTVNSLLEETKVMPSQTEQKQIGESDEREREEREFPESDCDCHAIDDIHTITLHM